MNLTQISCYGLCRPVYGCLVSMVSLVETDNSTRPSMSLDRQDAVYRILKCPYSPPLLKCILLLVLVLQYFVMNWQIPDARVFFYPTRDFYDDWKYHHYLRQVLTFDCECVWSAHFMRLKMFDGVVFLNLSYSLMKKWYPESFINIGSVFFILFT